MITEMGLMAPSRKDFDMVFWNVFEDLSPLSWKNFKEILLLWEIRLISWACLVFGRFRPPFRDMTPPTPKNEQFLGHKKIQWWCWDKHGSFWEKSPSSELPPPILSTRSRMQFRKPANFSHAVTREQSQHRPLLATAIEATEVDSSTSSESWQQEHLQQGKYWVYAKSGFLLLQEFFKKSLKIVTEIPNFSKKSLSRFILDFAL